MAGALWGGGRLWGRRGTDLTRYFPDLVPVLAARLPADVVVDAEVVAWDADRGRLDFQGLSRRLTAGRGLSAAAAARPAQLVCFDLLAAGGIDLRPRPLTERWARLEEVLSGMAAPIVLCQQTDDEATALHWKQTLTVAGIEGLVIKAARNAYPTPVICAKLSEDCLDLGLCLADMSTRRRLIRTSMAVSTG